MQRLWFFLLIVPTLLIACGGEREEPFDPGEPDEDIRERVPTRQIFSDSTEDPVNWTFVETDGKRIEILDNVDDYDEAFLPYADMPPGPQDFDEGQVVLYDGGWIDNSECEQQLNLLRMDAHAITEDEDLVEVTLVYQRDQADEDADCDQELLYRPFEFHYIESRGEIIIVEEVQGVSDNDSSDDDSDEDDNSDNTDDE